MLTAALDKETVLSQTLPTSPTPPAPRRGNFSVCGSFCRSVPRTPPPTKHKQPNTNRGFNFQGLWKKMKRSFSHEPD